MGQLDGMTALITGASRGIGLAIAQAFAREGADLWLTATSMERLAAARDALDPAPARCEVSAFDVADRAAVRAAVAQMESAWGRIDVLVNCAGAYKASPFTDYDVADIARLMDVNLFGTVHTMQSVLPGMRARGTGRVINIASTAGKWGSANQSAYNASKHAVVGLTRSVALEMAKDGITVNAICPGLVETDLADTLIEQYAEITGAGREAMLAAIMARVPVNRLIRPEEVAALAVFLAAPAAAGMTGQSILYDGGMLMV